MCETDTELKILPSERIFKRLRAHGAATGLVKRPCTPRSGVVVSSAQLDVGPEELRHFTCASSARAFDFALCFLHIGEYRLDLTWHRGQCCGGKWACVRDSY